MDKLDKQEAMEKGANPEVKLEDGELRIGEDEEKDVGMDTVSTEEIEWKDKDRASATLCKLSPELNAWQCELIWTVIDDARKDPEEMDIEKLYASATSIAEVNTKKELLVAGGNKESMFALVMKSMMEMVAKERKRSAKKIAEELRNMKDRNLFLVDTQKGLKERIAGYQKAATGQDNPSLLKKVATLTQEKEAAEIKAEASQMALFASDGDLAALKQQCGDDKRSLEELQKKLVRANATLDKYEENEQEHGTVPASTLAQIKLLRDELGTQIGLLSDQLTSNKRETMLHVDGRMSEHAATIAGMFQHQIEVLTDEGNARHARVESMFGRAMASMQEALHIGGGGFTPPDEEEIRRLEEIRGQQVAETKEIESMQKCTRALTRLEELLELKERRCDVWLGFNRWAQYTAVALLKDVVLGRLNGSESGLERMALVPNYSNRLNRDERGEITEITITDMPTMAKMDWPKRAKVVEGAAATNMQQQDEGVGGAQYTPEQNSTGQQLDAKQLATALKLNWTTYSAYESEDEDDVGAPASEESDAENEDSTAMTAHDLKNAKEEGKKKAKEMLDTSADDGVGNAAETDDEGHAAVSLLRLYSGRRVR